MIKKKIIVATIASLVCVTQSLAVDYSSTKIVDNLNTRVAAVKTAITPVPKASTTSTAQSTGTDSVQALSDSSEATRNKMGTTTKLFGTNTVIQPGIDGGKTTITIPTPPQTPVQTPVASSGVQATCGQENFDDVVKSTYGSVDLNRNYTDANGKVCNLGKMKMACIVKMERIQEDERITFTSNPYHATLVGRSDVNPYTILLTLGIDGAANSRAIGPTWVQNETKFYHKRGDGRVNDMTYKTVCSASYSANELWYHDGTNSLVK